jgi:chemosensory pili system protein ChpA (sensor histidine kinase/response regulator)
MSVEMEFDLGPLTWVKTELDNALQAAREALADWNGEDTNPLKNAASHLHQVYGALQIVDLQGVSLLTAETEHLLSDMANKDALRVAVGADSALSAISAIKSYLDGLMNGAPHIEMKLAPIYEEIMARRGVASPSPSELFYPDTQVRAPRREPELPLDDEARSRAIRKARAQYQKGLLQFLQNRDAVAGLMQMDQAVRGVEKLAPGPAQYTFWWTATGLIELLRHSGGDADFWHKRLCGRIDLQMRRLMEGSRQLAERLFRDVLYYVAQDGTPSGRAAEVRSLFELERYLAPVGESASENTHQPYLTQLHDSLTSAKDHWMRYCAGRGESLEPFQSAATVLFEATTRLPNPALLSLARIIQAVAKRLPGATDPTQNENLQLEMATGLLLAQNAADHFAQLGPEFKAQSDAQAMRLQAAIDPMFDVSRIPRVDLLDEFSRAAQEKLVLAQVTQEIQANLNSAEDILDKFFRDPTQRGALPSVPSLMKQIIGALNILQLDVAADLVKEAMRRIAYFSEHDADIAPADLDWVAEALSYLGLYMEALRYGRDDSKALIALLAKPMASGQREATVETQIQGETARIQEAARNWAEEGGAAEGRAELKANLTQLARDADLVADAQLRDKADAAVQALETAISPEQVRQAVQNITAPATPAPAPSADALRLAASSDEAIDRDILLTFIEEAQEVLGTIAVKLSRLNVSAYDNEAFTAIRRGFHTLKGSGRMVGLKDFAEPAWEVEQTLNAWLRDERAPSQEMLKFLESTADAFQVWVMELEDQGQARVESAHLIAAARRLRGGEEETPPPKAEAGALAETAEVAGDSPSPETASEVAQLVEADVAGEESVDIEGHILPAGLFHIFSDEALLRLADLGGALGKLGDSRHPGAWESFIRAAHTLAGISRTTGFLPLADAAHAVEIWAGEWPDKTQPLEVNAGAVLEGIVGQLRGSVEGILDGRFPQAMPEIEARLAELGAEPEVVVDEPEIEPQVEPQVEAAVEIPEEPEPVVESVAPTVAESLVEPAPVVPPVVVQPVLEPIPPVAAAPSAPLLAAPAARDELDEQLLPIFLEEAAGLLPQIGASLRAWRANPGDQAQRDALKRSLHTLKGSARMAGAMTLGEEVHTLESRIIEQGEAPADRHWLDELETAYDRMADHVERYQGGGSEPQAAAAEEALEAQPAEPQVGDTQARDVQQARETQLRMEDDLRLRQTLRAKADVLDTLLNEAGEVAISRARIENVLHGYKLNAQELTANVDRLRTQLREMEIQAETQIRSRLSQMETDESQFDPLEFDRFSRLQELTRLLAESVNDVSTVQENLLAGINDADTALTQQARMTRSLQQELMHIRMVPINNLAERLHRVVRQSAKETGRRAQLDIGGGQTEIDRTVLDRIAAPLEHLVRNAVAHGIEDPEHRTAAGKPEFGEVALTARQVGNEIVLVLEDDGAGIDHAAAREHAIERGWLRADEAASDEQLEALLFRSGFSTARQVTELAGRGVGLDVVRSEIAGIGGRVRLESTTGQGARFTIHLPLTLALSQVVLARAGGQTYALPANTFALVREVRAEEMAAIQDTGYLTLGEDTYPLRTLAELVGRTAAPPEGRYRTILLLKSGEQRIAVRVDALEGNYEAVVKNIGPQLARIAGVSGATVLGDGRVALIINPFQLAERAPRANVEKVEEVAQRAPLILVVDDSLTVRKITTRLLEREGFRVSTARDGVEALEVLEDELPAVMLLDIEMPRMDGFEVARHVRASGVTRRLPIIMITSRSADKHRNHAEELGVDAYMGKPYQEDELIAEINRLAGLTVAA